MERRTFVVAAIILASTIGLVGSVGAGQTNVTVVLTNQCQVTGFLVSQSSSNVVVSVGGGQKMTFAAGEISSLKMTETPVDILAGGPQISGAGSRAPTHITLALTNGSLLSGLLVSQSSSNFLVSIADGEKTNIARSRVAWSELATNAVVSPSAAAALAGGVPLAASNSIAAEFNQPHSEDEMRAMLRTPEGAALLKSVCEGIIGPGADPATRAATESYYQTVQEFEDGKIGIVELQVQAQTALGKLNQRPAQGEDEAQADRLNAFKQILQNFVTQPAPATGGPLE